MRLSLCGICLSAFDALPFMRWVGGTFYGIVDATLLPTVKRCVCRTPEKADCTEFHCHARGHLVKSSETSERGSFMTRNWKNTLLTTCASVLITLCACPRAIAQVEWVTTLNAAPVSVALSGPNFALPPACDAHNLFTLSRHLRSLHASQR